MHHPPISRENLDDDRKLSLAIIKSIEIIGEAASKVSEACKAQQDIAEENLIAGDMGTVVEFHPASEDYHEGYEVELFAGNGEAIAVVSVPATALPSVLPRGKMFSMFAN